MKRQMFKIFKIIKLIKIVNKKRSLLFIILIDIILFKIQMKVVTPLELIQNLIISLLMVMLVWALEHRCNRLIVVSGIHLLNIKNNKLINNNSCLDKDRALLTKLVNKKDVLILFKTEKKLVI